MLVFGSWPATLPDQWSVFPFADASGSCVQRMTLGRALSVVDSVQLPVCSTLETLSSF